jgi:hypothetical protein
MEMGELCCCHVYQFRTVEAEENVT